MTTIKAIIFENEMILYWDWQTNLGKRCYRTLVDGAEVFRSSKTHTELTNLVPCTEYTISVELLDEEGKLVRVLEEGNLKTANARKRIDVTAAPYFAKGDGKVLNTLVLQKAIDNCGVNETVYLPEGVYLSGALNLHSNMELYIDKGAVLQGTTAVEDYLPKRPSRFEGIEMMCYSSLLNMGDMDSKAGYNCENVVIRGGGIVNGGGNELRINMIETERVLLRDYIKGLGDKIKTFENENTIPGRARGRLINVSNAQNVIISDVGIYNSPSWNLHIIYSDNVITCGCHFISEGINNGDGWDPDSSTNCVLFNSVFSTGDNCIAIKSGKNPEGNVINRPCADIRVFDCKSIMGGGCAIGSEMSGGVENVYVWDCDFTTSYPGFNIKASKARGGYIRNVHIHNCIASVLTVKTAINYNNDGVSAPTPPIFENYELDNIFLTGWSTKSDSPCTALLFSGFEEEGHELKNVVLRNITLGRRKDGKNQVVEMWCVDGLTIEGMKVL